jgi:hypothetical protein
MASRTSRFSLLLLDEGEHLLDELSAVSFVLGPGAAPELLSTQRGRLRVCTRGLFFEPDDVRAPVVKYSLRSMPGRPQALALARGELGAAAAAAVAAERLAARDAFAFQPQQATEFKHGGAVAPYRTRVFEAPEPAATPKAAAVASASAAAARGSASALVGALAAEGGLFGAAQAPRARASAAPSDAAAAGSAGEHVVERTTVVIALLHSAAAQVVVQAQELWELQQACIGAPSGRERARVEPLLARLVEGAFDLSLLGDFRERALLPAAPRAVTCERVFPLVSIPGRLMVTERAVYFAPSKVNNVTSEPVQKWSIGRDVRRVQRRTRLQRQVGLELFATAGDGVLPGSGAASSGSPGGTGGSLCADAAAAGLSASHSATASVLFAFSSPSARDEVYRVILAALREKRRALGPAQSSATSDSGVAGAGADGDADDELGDTTPAKVAEVTRAWQARSVTNLSYLMFLNRVAGRTLVDLCQYPVLPWVVQDYSSKELNLSDPASFRDLSKPIGALNAQRIKSFRSRFAEMPGGEGQDAPFLWGTHYSTPGYILHWLVRQLPEHMLRLQAGRFDAPDRLFHDIARTRALTQP